MNGKISLAVVVVLLVAGCGIPAENTARPIDPPRGPFPSATQAPTTSAPRGTAVEQLYFIRDGKLTEVVRHVPVVPTVEQLMNDLRTGPTAAELDLGLSSALLGSDVIASITVDSGHARVELALPIEGTGRSDESFAYAQIVCTLTARSEISGVTFTQDGQAVAVPRGDGSLSSNPLTAADYTDLFTQA